VFNIFYALKEYQTMGEQL